jgi:hypothetical protein
MRVPVKKFLIFSMILISVSLPGTIQSGFSQKIETPSQTANSSGQKKEFIQGLIPSVCFWSAQMAFDVQRRPVMGVLVSDFCNSSGKEIALGDEISRELRAALNKQKQFHVYGKEDPLSQNLKQSLASDFLWSASSQRKFQQELLTKFKPFPVDLVVTGQVSKAAEDRLRVVVNFIPFFERINLVETESGRTNVHSEQFFSPVLSPQEIDEALTVTQKPPIPKGRLVIISSTNFEKGKSPGRDRRASLNTTPRVTGGDFPAGPRKLKSYSDLNCWLDDQSLSVLTEWEDQNKKEYYDVLSGFAADTIWFDNSIEEGPHAIFFSLAKDPAKNQYKTFLTSFFIKPGTSNYLFFTLYSDSLGEPAVRVRHIIDPENQSLPF